VRALGGMVAVVFALALALERWPAAGRVPRFPDVLEIGPGIVAFLSGPTVEGDHARAEAGDVAILIRSREPLASVTLTASGDGLVDLPGRPRLAVPPTGLRVEVPLDLVARLTGRRGAHEALTRQRISVESRGELALRLAPSR